MAGRVGVAGAVALALGLACWPASALATTDVAAPDPLAQKRATTAREALAALPDHGPVRVVGVSVGPAGRPEVEVEKVATPQAAAAAIARMRTDRDVTAIEIDTRVHALDHPVSTDPRRGSQWGMTRLRAEHAWGVSRGTGATVAVIDSGVDGQHPDLQGVLVPGYDYVTDLPGGQTDPAGHGTHVAGTVVAVPGNGIGVVGLAPDARVMSLRVLDENGSGDSSDVAQAVLDAVDNGADVINMSLGGPGNSTALAAAIQYALDEGVPVVASMGNARQQGDPVFYPAALPGVIAVAATASNDTSGYFSSTGAHVSVSAPGVDIWSTSGGGYALASGTSMAAPHVSAVVALLTSVDPALSAEAVRTLLMCTAQDLEAPGFDRTTGAGLVDPVAALAALGAGPTPPLPLSAVSGVRGDWTGEGTVDVLATTSDGKLMLHAGKPGGQPVGAVCPARQIGHGWGVMTYLGSPGDINGDRRTDLVARSADGSLYMYAGKGGGTFGRAVKIGQKWNAMTALITSGDVDGDRRPDLMARRNDGTLHLYKFGTTGLLTYTRQIGAGWNSMKWMVGTGDLNGDGRGDVLGITTGGSMYAYRGTATGLVGAGQVGEGWGSMTWVTSPGDMNRDGRGDVLARNAAGDMLIYPGKVDGVLGGALVASGWSGYVRIL